MMGDGDRPRDQAAAAYQQIWRDEQLIGAVISWRNVIGSRQSPHIRR
ncbi:hypothetical protein [Bradyrhizobium sp. CB3481]|nr:hypothetical protein [Bradyrhizobium sp. CB3481]WFU19443.1 hypothetical protein QA643_14485 [Bradyrhizobium sp. CB3481]